MRTLVSKYKHALSLLYFLIYLPWFVYLENTVVDQFHVIHMHVDDMIPFLEIFIIPYMLWFLYVTATILYFFLTNTQEYYKLILFLFTGMTIFLIISTIFPNGHYLRPAAFERDNIFTHMVSWLYSTDTPTNLFPSIHVYNSIGCSIAISKSASLKDKKWIQGGSLFLTVSIILSTVFLKQHSVFDVITGIGLAAILYKLIYKTDYTWAKSKKSYHEQPHQI